MYPTLLHLLQVDTTLTLATPETELGGELGVQRLISWILLANTSYIPFLSSTSEINKLERGHHFHTKIHGGKQAEFRVESISLYSLFQRCCPWLLNYNYNHNHDYNCFILESSRTSTGTSTSSKAHRPGPRASGELFTTNLVLSGRRY